MTKITLPKVPQYVEESELREAFLDYGREVARVTLETAANWCERKRMIRGGEVFGAEIRTLEIKHAE